MDWFRQRVDEAKYVSRFRQAVTDDHIQSETTTHRSASVMSSGGRTSKPSGIKASEMGFPSSSSDDSWWMSGGKSGWATRRERELARGSSSPSSDSRRLKERATRSPGRG